VRRLADSQAGAKPQLFGFPTVTDGIGMGTEAMKYSLVSREVIADAIETSVNGQAMDGVLAIGGCDKNMPGAMMAIARMNVPGLFVYGGTIKPGNWKGQALTIVSAFEAVGAFAAGKMQEQDFIGVEKNACPSGGFDIVGNERPGTDDRSRDNRYLRRKALYQGGHSYPHVPCGFFQSQPSFRVAAESEVDHL
jgi:hypothetical protein